MHIFQVVMQRFVLLFISILSAFTATNAYSQKSKIDSLLTVIKTAKEDTNKVLRLNDVSWEYLTIGEYNSALQYGKEALVLSDKIKFYKGKAEAYSIIGSIYNSQGNYDQALENYFASLKIKEETGDKKGSAGTYSNIGTIYHSQGKYELALKKYFSALKIFEEVGDKRYISISYNNIGNIYHKQGNNDKALENHFSALKIREETGDQQGIAYSMNNIGNIYHIRSNYNQALEYYLGALKIFEEMEDKKNIAASYNNIGSIYQKQGDYGKALDKFNSSLKIREDIGDKQGMASCYINIGITYKAGKDFEQAIEYFRKSLAIADAIGSKDDMKIIYKNLAETHALLNNYMLAYNYELKHAAIKDSIFNTESSKQIAEMSTKYETEKKEQQIKLLEKDGEIQKTVRNSFIAGFALMLTLAGVSYISYRNKRKAHEIISEQKAILEEKNKDITDSINYAKRIQHALLKEQEQVSEHLPEHFILFKPKDIVSGDFYWSVEKQGHLYIAAVDCTGHGVPGAFMSMLGIAFLNEITANEKLLTPGEILNSLRDKVIKELRQTGKEGENKDGMDISLIHLNPLTKELQWAGANNPLWIIRPVIASCHPELVEGEAKQSVSNKEIASGTRNDGYELTEIKADKQPIGQFENSKNFTTHHLNLAAGDIIYLFTDGYADQFGGEKGKKFKYSKLKELLLSIQNKNMNEQKEIMDKTFTSWKGSLEQVDDVCVIGVRV